MHLNAALAILCCQCLCVTSAVQTTDRPLLQQILDFLDLCQKKRLPQIFYGRCSVLHFRRCVTLYHVIGRGCNKETTFPMFLRRSPALIKHNMAPAGRGVVVALSLLYLCRAIFSTEYFSTLTFFNSELHKHGCSSPLEWEEYASDCGETSLVLICHVLFKLQCRLLASYQALPHHPLTDTGQAGINFAI